MSWRPSRIAANGSPRQCTIGTPRFGLRGCYWTDQDRRRVHIHFTGASETGTSQRRRSGGTPRIRSRSAPSCGLCFFYHAYPLPRRSHPCPHPPVGATATGPFFVRIVGQRKGSRPSTESSSHRNGKPRVSSADLPISERRLVLTAGAPTTRSRSSALHARCYRIRCRLQARSHSAGISISENSTWAVALLDAALAPSTRSDAKHWPR